MDVRQKIPVIDRIVLIIDEMLPPYDKNNGKMTFIKGIKVYFTIRASE